MELTQRKALDLFRYDPETGYLHWRVDVGKKIKAGRRAGSVHGRGYINVGVNGRTYRAHRLIWLMEHSEWPDQIDHINHIRHDNRLENLRSVETVDNNQNAKRRSDNQSGVTGVHWCKKQGKWFAFIKGDYITMGDDWFEVVCARKSAEVEHGFHVNHGM